MKALKLSIIAAVVLAGCESTPLRYQNYGANQQQFMKDRYECYRENQQRASSAYVDRNRGVASSRVIPSCSAFQACLAARGYYESASGNLFVPDSAGVECQ